MAVCSLRQQRSGARPPVRAPNRCRILAALVLGTCLTGCATTEPSSPAAIAEALVAAPGMQVRSAVIQVLTERGYVVRDEEDRQGRLGTGYRQETHSPWDWLLRTLFGVGRSQVDVTLVPDGETATRLSIQVNYESKDALWRGWHPADPPVSQSPTDHLREIRNTLGLL